ncbi:MAG: hypothetical protein ABEI52_09675, partial [Halobacteriaceae archaeon]
MAIEGEQQSEISSSTGYAALVPTATPEPGGVQRSDWTGWVSDPIEQRARPGRKHLTYHNQTANVLHVDT